MRTLMSAEVDGAEGGAPLRIRYDKDGQKFSVEVPSSVECVFGHVEAQRLIRFLEQCMMWTP